MTMVNCGLTEWPRPEMRDFSENTGGSLTTINLDSTNDSLYWVGRSPVTDSLSTIYFRTATIPAGGGDVVDVRIETVSNGRRSGSLWASGTNINVSVSDSDDNIWKTATLTNPASLTAGDEFAIVIASNSGTPDVRLALTANLVVGGGFGHYPLIVQNSTGTDTPIEFGLPEWIVEFTTAGIKHIPGLSPADGSLDITAFSNATATHERALRFISPIPRRVVGARLFLGNITAGADFTISLWDSGGTTDASALAQITQDGDFPTGGTRDGYVMIFFPTPVTIAKDTVYYLGVRANTANTLVLFSATVNGTNQPANSIRTFSHESTELYLATRTWSAGTASGWTVTTTTYPFISLISDQLDDGSESGGSNIVVVRRM